MRKIFLLALTLCGAFVLAEDSHHERVAKALKKINVPELCTKNQRHIDNIGHEVEQLCSHVTRHLRNELSAEDAQRLTLVFQAAQNSVSAIIDGLSNASDDIKRMQAEAAIQANMAFLTILLMPYFETCSQGMKQEEFNALTAQKTAHFMEFIKKILKDQQEILEG